MKKISSFILAIAMIISMAFVMNLSPITAHAVDASVWDGTTTTQPTSMKTIDGVYYYEIYTAEELAYVAKTGGDWYKYNYILMNDIYLNSADVTYDANGELTIDATALNPWRPIDHCGVFDGNGFTIYGLYINSPNKEATFIGTCKSIKNLKIANSYFCGFYAAGICLNPLEEVNNCTFDGAAIAIAAKAGTEESMWVANGCAAGICVYTFDAKVIDCTNYGDIFGQYNAAGIVNLPQSSISGCANYGNVYSSNIAAGICNQTSWDGNINNCSNYGFVNGVSKVAGIVSDADTSYIRSCQNAGNIKGASYVGGICGHAQYMNIFSDTAITNSFNTGNIEGAEYIGGICGYVSQAYVDSCYNTGNINGSGNYVGGIIGYLNYGDCKNSTNVGYVTNSNLKSETGALIGHSQSIWGDGVVSGCQYIKTDTVNTKLVAFGNTTTDTDNVISKDASFFCVNSDKTLNKNGHTYSSTVPCDAMCDTCGYERTVTHTYDNVKYDSDKHWYECDCGEVKSDSEESHTGGTATCTSKAKCDVCKQAYGDLNANNHTIATIWTSANDQHYHICTNGCDAKLELANCADSDKDHKCDVCSTAMGTHEAANGKHICDYCGQIVTECADSDKDHKCDVCSAAMGTHEAASGKHTCDYCNQTVTECSDSDKDHKCDVCGKVLSTVSGTDNENESSGDKVPKPDNDKPQTGCGSVIAGTSVGAIVLISIGAFVVMKKRKTK